VNFGASPSLVRARLMTTPNQRGHPRSEDSAGHSSSHDGKMSSLTERQKTIITFLAIIAFASVGIAIAFIAYNEGLLVVLSQ